MLPLRILLVMPDLFRQRLVRTALSRCGALVTTEESAEAALRRCAAAARGGLSQHHMPQPMPEPFLSNLSIVRKE